MWFNFPYCTTEADRDVVGLAQQDPGGLTISVPSTAGKLATCVIGWFATINHYHGVGYCAAGAVSAIGHNVEPRLPYNSTITLVECNNKIHQTLISVCTVRRNVS